MAAGPQGQVALIGQRFHRPAVPEDAGWIQEVHGDGGRTVARIARSVDSHDGPTVRVLEFLESFDPDSVQVPGRRATDIAPLLQIDDGRVLNQLPIWAADPATRKAILVDNPARLYQF